ncbi:MAG: DUF5666 domain-containing protein [Anaerolineae bacterium]|nr:DUF5666 domain-containing protein [Anaerolineae bacterium]
MKKINLLLTSLLTGASVLAAPTAILANTDDSGPKVYGIVAARPTGTTIGNWTIGSTQLQVTVSTRFEYEHGAIDTGTCVEAKYYQNGNVLVASKVESQAPYKCGSSNIGTPSPIGSGRSYKIRQYGRVESISNSIWQINGVSYTQTAATRIKRAPSIGACVKVEYSQSNGVNILHEVELAANRCL